MTYRQMIAIALIWLLAGLSGSAIAKSPPGNNGHNLAERMDLARLVDLSREKLGINIEYDPKLFQGAVIALRLDHALSDEKLWELTLSSLSKHGLTVIRMPGSDVYTVIQLTNAAAQARIEPGSLHDTHAGFVTIILELKHRDPAGIIQSLQPLMSRVGGVLTAVSGTNKLMISDLKPRVEQTMDHIELLDVPLGAQSEMIQIPVHHLSVDKLVLLANSAIGAYGSLNAAQLKGKIIPAPDGGAVILIAPQNLIATWRALIDTLDQPGAPAKMITIDLTYRTAPQVVELISTATTAMNAVSGTSLRGQLIPSPDDDAIVIVAPETEVAIWNDLIKRFDRRQAVQTLTYSAQHFPASEVANLIEQTTRETGPRGSGDRWKLSTDELTNTVVITASPDEHAHIKALIERLDAMPASARRPVRTFPIKNRSVRDLLDILVELVDAGVFSSEPRPTRSGSDSRQQSVRPKNEQSTKSTDPSNAMPDSTPQEISSPRPDEEDPPLMLTADESTNTIIAIGEIRLLAQLERLIQTLDIQQSQVMIEVLAISLTDSDSLDFGVELEKMDISTDATIAISSLFGLGVLPGTGSSGTPEIGQGGANGFTGVALSPGNFSVVIRALQAVQNGRALNIPKVLVNNNQDAILDSTLQQPFAQTNASTTVATTSFGGTQDAGTSITVRPQITKGDHLVLDYTVSISSFVGSSSNIALPPPRQQTNIQSVVTIPDGYTVVVGGLEIKSESESTSQIPLIGDIPIIGEIFKSRSKSGSSSRFYVFIRANVLRHGGFEDLKYLSRQDSLSAGIDDGWPTVKPRIIR